MADDQEKTEEPTPQKIEDARKKGNVPKSQEVGGLFTLFVAILMFMILIPFIYDHIIAFFEYIFSINHEMINQAGMIDLAVNTMKEFLIMVLPLAIAVAIAGIVAAISQFGFLFTLEAIEPKFDKLNPIKGLGNLFSMKKVIEGVKIVLKSSISLGVGFWIFWSFAKELPLVVRFPLGDQLRWLGEKVLIIAAFMMFVTLIFALADLIITRYQYFKGLKMSLQEIKDEYKKMEGDPLIKGKIRQIQMEMSKKRMMSDVPSASVVVTNPTHYAVAIRYNQEVDHAPTVIAKGMDVVAHKIRDIAIENNIQIVQNPPLARALYSQVDLGGTIPEELYQATAEVLAFVFQTDKKGN
jgi:flagellar biosynthetic protein FlhB